MAINNFIIGFFKKNFTPQISVEQENLIMNFFKKETFQKKELVFMNGDVNTKHYFIEKGLMRLYLIDSAGKEFNILFAKEKQLIGDLTTPEPTDFNLEAIEACAVYSISERGFQELIETLNLQHQSHPKSSIRRSYVNTQRRLVSILSKTAEENYTGFKKNYPDLIHRLPQYHIASYLGISAEFLSKIIKKASKN